MNPSFEPAEIVTNAPTRSARLKWVIVVDKAAPLGQQVNAVACISAATGSLVNGLTARGGRDADGAEHPGLPWAGCSVLGASAEQLINLRAKAASVDGLLVVDMPLSAQTNRIYDDYLAELAETPSAEVAATAISIIGERADVDALVKRYSLLS